MLALTRRLGESLIIGDDVKITVLNTKHKALVNTLVLVSEYFTI